MHKKIVFVAALLLCSVIGLSQEDTTVYSKVDTPATYPGGANAWQKFLNKNMRFPMEAVESVPRKKSQQWTVRIGFTVTKDGKVTDIRPESNHGLGLEAECIRLMKKSGTWVPGKLNGAPVNHRTMQPFVFVIEP